MDARYYYLCKKYKIDLLDQLPKLVPTREVDISLINLFTKKGLETDLNEINQCKKYLDVAMLSEMTSVSGK